MRLLFLLTLVRVLSTLLGAASEQKGPDGTGKASTTKKRAHALWRQRQSWYHSVAVREGGADDRVDSLGSEGELKDGNPLGELRQEALFLAGLVADTLPNEPEALGFLALVELCEARRAAQIGLDGTRIPLRERAVGLTAHPRRRRFLQSRFRRLASGSQEPRWSGKGASEVAAVRLREPSSPRRRRDQVPRGRLGLGTRGAPDSDALLSLSFPSGSRTADVHVGRLPPAEPPQGGLGPAPGLATAGPERPQSPGKTSTGHPERKHQPRPPARSGGQRSSGQ